MNSHPIQYFAPLYSFCSTQGTNIEIWYWSDETLKGSFDKQFGTNVKWDIPLLEGYNYRFFKNNSWKPSIYNGFFGLINLGVLKALFKEPKCIIIVHGWGYCTHVLTIIFARLFRHKVAIRGESPYNQEIRKSKFNKFIKKVFLQNILFRFTNFLLYIGKQNKDFYKFYGVIDKKLFFATYAIDNNRFRNSVLHSASENNLRYDLGIAKNEFTILFSGKYIEKKRPLMLLEAFKKINHKELVLIMVGEGDLRVVMEKYIFENGLSKVFMTGFINQTELPKYYKIANVFVMCSSNGETWGLTVNEAMNFSLPIIVSDRVGCKDDLVQENINGFSFISDDVEDLTKKLSKPIALDAEKRKEMGNNSVKIINNYSYGVINECFVKLLSIV